MMRLLRDAAGNSSLLFSSPSYPAGKHPSVLRSCLSRRPDRDALKQLTHALIHARIHPLRWIRFVKCEEEICYSGEAAAFTQSSSSFPSYDDGGVCENVFITYWSWRQVQSVNFFCMVGKGPTLDWQLPRGLQSLPCSYFKVKEKKQLTICASVLIISSVIISYFSQVHLPP